MLLSPRVKNDASPQPPSGHCQSRASSISAQSKRTSRSSPCIVCSTHSTYARARRVGGLRARPLRVLSGTIIYDWRTTEQENRQSFEEAGEVSAAGKD